MVSLAPIAQGQGTGDCSVVGELVVSEGVVERQRVHTASWNPAVVGERLCRGDTLRVHAASRATLLLVDSSALRLAENTTAILGDADESEGLLIDLVRGLIHVISRDPRELHFRTPFANAGLEGTEFDIGVDADRQETAIAVLEGEVRLTTPAGEIGVPSGQLAKATPGGPPTLEPLPEPIELMRWASYYPPLIDGLLPAPDAETPAAADADFYARRAAARLATARLPPAEADIDAALALEPNYAPALALRALLALASAALDSAAELAARATATDPRSTSALVVLSYVEQAQGDPDAAEAAARVATALEPSNAIALTRLAELRLARGATAESLALAEQAHRAAPHLSAPLVVRGFAELSAFATAAAENTFAQATALEAQAPLPRLGLALAAAQRGDSVEGRRQLELAVANDPANALTRSYMAKLYVTENRTELAGSQLDLAKRFAPADATPWLYGALYDLQRNRPIHALQQLRGARARNGDRAAFRSELALDEDVATRSAALSRVYTGLGFNRVALADAWQAVADAPTEHAGHRLLADLYAYEPRHEIARVSELLVAQLLQPANVAPLKPQLGQVRLIGAQRAGPSEASFDEFTAPIAANGPQLTASAVTGSAATQGFETTVAGLNDRLSYSAGHYSFATDGFRTNNDVDQRVTNAFVQFRPNRDTSLQAELRSVRTEHGDLTLRFDADLFSRTLRSSDRADSLRLGSLHRLSANDALLSSLVLQEATAAVDAPGLFSLTTQHRGYAADVQHLHRGARHRTQAGLLYAHQEAEMQPVASASAQATIAQLSAYGYWHVDLADTLTLTAGATFDRIDDFVSDDALSPKLGLLWRPSAATTVRAAAFETLFGSLTSSAESAQPRLEPVQVAGFTQLLFGGQADRAKVLGVGVDHSFGERLFVGWEATHRDTDRPVTIPLGPTNLIQWTTLTEHGHQAYAYWAPTDRLSLAGRYDHGRFSSAPVALFGYTDMKLTRLPLEARYFLPSGWTVGGRATHAREAGTFQRRGSSLFDPEIFTPGSDEFWVLDAFVSYRLPHRRGIVSLNADNLLDERFQFQDAESSLTALAPERLVSLRFTLAFD